MLCASQSKRHRVQLADTVWWMPFNVYQNVIQKRLLSSYDNRAENGNSAYEGWFLVKELEACTKSSFEGNSFGAFCRDVSCWGLRGSRPQRCKQWGWAEATQ